MTEISFKRIVANSVDNAARCARRMRAACLPIIMEEMNMDIKQARKAYRRLVGE